MSVHVNVIQSAKTGEEMISCECSAGDIKQNEDRVEKRCLINTNLEMQL